MNQDNEQEMNKVIEKVRLSIESRFICSGLFMGNLIDMRGSLLTSTTYIQKVIKEKNCMHTYCKLENGYIYIYRHTH